MALLATWIDQPTARRGRCTALTRAVGGIADEVPTSSEIEGNRGRFPGRDRDKCPNEEWEIFPGLNVRLWPGHIRNPDVIVTRRGAMSRYVSGADVLLLVEITSPGNFRQDRVVKHGDDATAGIPFYLRVDLEKGHEAVEATLFELVDGEYHEAARSVDGVLSSTRPWPFETDLRALAQGR